MLCSSSSRLILRATRTLITHLESGQHAYLLQTRSFVSTSILSPDLSQTLAAQEDGVYVDSSDLMNGQDQDDRPCRAEIGFHMRYARIRHLRVSGTASSPTAWHLHPYAAPYSNLPAPTTTSLPPPSFLRASTSHCRHRHRSTSTSPVSALRVCTLALGCALRLRRQS